MAFYDHNGRDISADLDRHITGNWGEDSVPDDEEEIDEESIGDRKYHEKVDDELADWNDEVSERLQERQFEERS